MLRQKKILFLFLPVMKIAVYSLYPPKNIKLLIYYFSFNPECSGIGYVFNHCYCTDILRVTLKLSYRDIILPFFVYFVKFQFSSWWQVFQLRDYISYHLLPWQKINNLKEKKKNLTSDFLETILKEIESNEEGNCLPFFFLPEIFKVWLEFWENAPVLEDASLCAKDRRVTPDDHWAFEQAQVNIILDNPLMQLELLFSSLL